MQANALAWERWVYLFAQSRQLAALARFLPTGDPPPELKPTTYDMVLSSLLLHPAGGLLVGLLHPAGGGWLCG